MKRKRYRWGRIIAAILIVLLLCTGIVIGIRSLFRPYEKPPLSSSSVIQESSEESIDVSSQESSEISDEEASLVESSETVSSSKPASSNSSTSAQSAGLAGGTSPSDWNLILVSAKHPLPDDFSVSLASVGNGYKGDKRVVSSLNAMIKGAKQDGITLTVCSAYRTKERSAYLYQNQINQWLAKGYSQEEAEKEAARWVAPPGTSEHHTGLAFDIVTPSYQQLNHGFANTAAAKWMKTHAHEYGFILRFPKDKQDITGITFEPWHFRYVGRQNAEIIYEKGICLEEYIDMIS